LPSATLNELSKLSLWKNAASSIALEFSNSTLLHHFFALLRLLSATTVIDSLVEISTHVFPSSTEYWKYPSLIFPTVLGAKAT